MTSVFFVSASVCLGLVGCLGQSEPLWRDRLQPRRGESSALAVYGGLSRCAPRPLMRPPSFRPQGPLCPYPTWPRLGTMTRKLGLKPKTWPRAGPVRAWPASLSPCLAIESLSRSAPRASNTLDIPWAPGASLWSPQFP